MDLQYCVIFFDMVTDEETSRSETFKRRVEAFRWYYDNRPKGKYKFTVCEVTNEN